MKKILICQQPEVQKPAVERLKELAEIVEPAQPRGGYFEATSEFLEKAKDVNIIFSNVTVDDEFLNTTKELEYIQRYSIGYDNVDLKAATKHGVTVCNIAEIMSEAVAQHTMALILARSKDIVRTDRLVRRSGMTSPGGRKGIQLLKKTLGIIGLGSIGKRVALKMKHAFDMHVIAYDPYVLPARAQLFGAELVSLDKLLKESHVVTITCALTEDTYHLIGEEELKLMRKDAILVNTARGAIIDEQALIKALKEEWIRGAGLDVFENEPLTPDNPLCKLDNVILTSHNASATDEAHSEARRGAISNIERYLRGEKPHWILNPDAQ